MNDALQYAGKRAVVTGCASGMGAAVARGLNSLGSRVTGMDVKVPTDPAMVDAFTDVNLSNEASIAAAVDQNFGPECWKGRVILQDEVDVEFARYQNHHRRVPAPGTCKVKLSTTRLMTPS